MKCLFIGVTFLILVGCASTPKTLQGSMGIPSFADLQAICHSNQSYGEDEMMVYTAIYDAYVAYKKSALPITTFCEFQNDLAKQYQLSVEGKSSVNWSDYLNQVRAQAISWRSRVDPTLRGG